MEKTKIQNYTLVIIPKYDSKNGCKDIIEEIKRHVDGVSDMTIKYDTVCVYCQRIWEKEWIEGEKPMCCNMSGKIWQKEDDERNLHLPSFSKIK